MKVVHLYGYTYLPNSAYSHKHLSSLNVCTRRVCSVSVGGARLTCRPVVNKQLMRFWRIGWWGEVHTRFRPVLCSLVRFDPTPFPIWNDFRSGDVSPSNLLPTALCYYSLKLRYT